MLPGLKLQPRPRFKRKRFEMAHHTQRREAGVRMDIASLRSEMPGLFTAGEQADNNNACDFGDKITALQKREQAPFGAANTTFDSASRVRWAAAARRSGLAADRNPQRVLAGNHRQGNFRSPRFDVDQLEHVSALVSIGTDPLAIPAGSFGPREMESTASNRDFIASTSSGTLADCVQTDTNTGEDSIGTEVASCAGLRIGLALNIGDTERGCGTSGPGCAGRRSQQQPRTHQFPHTLHSH